MQRIPKGDIGEARSKRSGFKEQKVLFLQIDSNCGNYDESQAWPLVLDMYVEWRQENGI